MNHIMSTDKTVTMNSLEIAELTGKLHGNVMRTIKTLIARGVIAQSQIDLVVNNQSLSANNKTKVYVFSGEQGKRDSIVLIAQLSPEFTAKIVDRWQELEQKNKQLAIPQTYAEALRLAADQAEQLALAAPKVSYYDKVVERDTLLNATQVGQKIGLSAVMLNRHLDDLGVYNKAIKRGRAFRQSFVDAGHGIMRQTEAGHAQPMITLTGEAWIIEKLTSEGII